MKSVAKKGTTTRIKGVSCPYLAALSHCSFLLFASVMVGLVPGYSIVGDGEGLRILRVETWQDLYQYISGGT
ncbi:DNA-directed RNA polymerase subunit beta [Salicibibacter cibarius]|uniref:DNA-directed RNA polymerase subunit beta n=1 Tax=Salicibibacter cibarius TaxID=2743000 RepID=A0A7T6Z7T5_9BACI|nr:DNA-directed RNA polymerase subunit beta [Salicibibacter cibarius]QQK77966.1 DNA-directed RNA polymerase subunit beta [Salicibibacter cibarius]